jgi:hypothetical protein
MINQTNKEVLCYKGSKFKNEQITMKLREMEINISQGMSVSEAARQICQYDSLRRQRTRRFRIAE